MRWRLAEAKIGEPGQANAVGKARHGGAESALFVRALQSIDERLKDHRHSVNSARVGRPYGSISRSCNAAATACDKVLAASFLLALLRCHSTARWEISSIPAISALRFPRAIHCRQVHSARLRIGKLDLAVSSNLLRACT